MNLPAQDYATINLPQPQPLHSGFDRTVYRALGALKRQASVSGPGLQNAEAITQQSLKLKSLNLQMLAEKLHHYQTLCRRQEPTIVQLPEIFALLTEASARTLNLRPYPVQIYAALLIWSGHLAEMATGEGKSLTACLPAIIHAWSGKPCHIITANDYLATRDAQELAPLYKLCGVSVGTITAEMNSQQRQQNYRCGVVYVTGKELLADFLRDRLKLGEYQQASRIQAMKAFSVANQDVANLVMRGVDAAIVDEADSVLIDEAVTPLIISSPQENEAFLAACHAADQLRSILTINTDFHINQRKRLATLTEQGQRKISELTGHLPALLKSKQRREELVTTALTAEHLFHLDQHFVIEENKVVIVDEFTGRMMPQRSWRQGIQQALEIQQGLPVTPPTDTLARLSFQRFFRYFRKLGGMTGTARESADEFWDIYQLQVKQVPTNKPCQRKKLTGKFFPVRSQKWSAICGEIGSLHSTGQPVLIGTRTIADSEELAILLKAANIPFKLLNAVHHRQEADIIATAGQIGAVTIATNMAGRGTDIKLGPGVAEQGGLHVIISELHDSPRIDRQLAGRCARQGEPGTFRIYTSLDDMLLQRHGSNILAGITLSGRSNNFNWFAQTIAKRAQRTAQQLAYRQRRQVMQSDEWLSESLSLTRTAPQT